MSQQKDILYLIDIINFHELVLNSDRIQLIEMIEWYKEGNISIAIIYNTQVR
jgi:hypothetical protein